MIKIVNFVCNHSWLLWWRYRLTWDTYDELHCVRHSFKKESQLTKIVHMNNKQTMSYDIGKKCLTTFLGMKWQTLW